MARDLSCAERHPRALRFGRRLLMAILFAGLAACGDPGDPSLRDLREGGGLVVLTRNAPTTYFEGRDGLEGLEYDLTQAFAKAHDLPVSYKVLDSIEEVLSALERGEGHLAAAGLTRTEARQSRFLFGPDYRQVQQQVVCHREAPLPSGVADLVGRSLLIISGSSYEERLRELKAETPSLAWTATSEMGTEQILEEVWARKVDCTVADSNIVAINRRYYPELQVAFALSEEQSLAWVLPPGAERLREALAIWLDDAERTGLLGAIDDRYYGHTESFDFVDLRAFRRRIDKRLPGYRKMFEEAGAQFGIPWTLLAAQAYQESHWNPKARSPTGVRGMMMLTRDTARELGVDDRLNPWQSILGGARYMSRIRERLDAVEDPERWWFALAAYNMGMGHLKDARVLAERLGKDPNRWVDVQSVLPLLSRKQHYRTLKHGYARGLEAMRYVQRVRDYRDILERTLAS